MVVEELFERVVQMSKTVWRKRGDEISRQEVTRMVAAAGQPRARFTVKDETDEG